MTPLSLPDALVRISELEPAFRCDKSNVWDGRQYIGFYYGPHHLSFLVTSAGWESGGGFFEDIYRSKEETEWVARGLIADYCRAKGWSWVTVGQSDGSGSACILRNPAKPFPEFVELDTDGENEAHAFVLALLAALEAERGTG